MNTSKTEKRGVLQVLKSSVDEGMHAALPDESVNVPCDIAFDLDDHEAHDECGVFGAFSPGEDVARMSYFALFSLQHRGQESAGIAVSDGSQLSCYKDMGLVTQVFHEEGLAQMKGHIGIGHVRYSTTGSSNLANAQPIMGRWKGIPLAIAHNGNLVNAYALRAELEALGESFISTNDSEIIIRLISRQDTPTIEEAIIAAARKLDGAYSLVILLPDRVIALRDPHAIRPLCIGQLDEKHFVFASESCALNVIGARLLRDVEPGEMVIASADGLQEIQALTSTGFASCVFEFIYIARPDSNIFGKSLHGVRRRLGQMLAKEYPVAADVVIAVPDTGTPAAIGYAEASRIPFNEGLIKNRYIGRTFIQPDQRVRDRGVQMKFNALRETLAGKRVVVVDDSIVRGTTKRKLVKVLRDAGAREIHVRITAPPYRFPCFYGVDTADRSQLIAANMTVEEIRKHIGADSLGFLSMGGLMKAIGVPKENFCHACFTGDYPVPIPADVKVTKFSLEAENADPLNDTTDEPGPGLREVLIALR